MATPLNPEESDRLKKEFLEIYKQNGGYSYAAAKQVGVRYNTVHYWMTKDEEFVEQCKIVKELMLDRAEAELYNRAMTVKERDTCLLFFLKTKGKDRGYTERTEITGKDGGAQQHETKMVEYPATDSDVDAIERIKRQAVEEYKASLLLEHKPTA